MSRELHFPVEIRSNSGKPRLRVSIAPDYSAADMFRSAIPADTVLPALDIFAAISGEVPARGGVTTSGSEIVFDLPSHVAADAWKVAVLVNLIDYATAADGDMETRLVDKVTVEASALGSIDFPALQAALEARKEAAREEMTARLPADMEVHPDLGRIWPADAVEFFIKVVMKFSRTLQEAEKASVHASLESLDSLVAWSGFETERNPEQWLENSWVPYPVEIAVEAATAEYSVEMAPSDISLVFVLFREALEKSLDVDIAAWDFEFREGF
ncbi:hypothetical protein [Rhizobium terrae]|uniref:hypothetical protein n=1 Tax=Rhizobium terrae TaxID=2171756 RepID=UPI000E3D0974|nr:hypothetical protein [Rhizobium terrae]